MNDNRNKFAQKANQYLKDIWGDRELGIDKPALLWNEPVSPAEVAFLLSRYPYLQMINTSPEWSETVMPRFRQAPSGWMIHDYGEAMSSSPGALLFGPGNPELIQYEEGEEGGGSDVGSVVRQTFETAENMIQWAIEKGWPGVEIISGTELMKWAAWFVAQSLSYPLAGYEPSKKDELKRLRVMRLRREAGMAGPEVAPGV